MKSVAALAITMLSVGAVVIAQSPAPSPPNRPQIVRSIKYINFSPINADDIRRVFQENNVNLKVETAYDQQQIDRATAVLNQLLGQEGNHDASVNVAVRPIPPNSLELTFTVVTP